MIWRHRMYWSDLCSDVCSCVLEALLPQRSVACQIRVASKVVPQWPAVLVTVLTIVIVLVPLLSVAVGVSKVQGVPNSTVLLVLLQVITGTVVSTTVTLDRKSVV